MGGDLNSVLDPGMDRTSGSLCSASDISSNFLNRFMLDLNLSDPWRLNHPKDNNFTFFSPRYKSFSRLDYIFISSSAIKYVAFTDIFPIIISDHSPVVLTIGVHAPIPRFKIWHFNVFLLQNTDFIKNISQVA